MGKWYLALGAASLIMVGASVAEAAGIGTGRTPGQSYTPPGWQNDQTNRGWTITPPGLNNTTSNRGWSGTPPGFQEGSNPATSSRWTEGGITDAHEGAKARAPADASRRAVGRRFAGHWQDD